MLKVAIVGCGKIADSHASQIGRIRGCEIVAACDREPLMAQQMCERFPIKRPFSDVQEMLSDTCPDVVHICTPPGSHYDVAKLCLQSGSHVYVEKPFTVDEAQAQSLIQLAKDRNLKLAAGHDDQFTHVARRMRALVKSGYLGDGPMHMESYYCYQMASTGYAGALLGEKTHWIRRLPGKLLHNIISHGIARIAEHIQSESPEIHAFGFVSPLLRSMGETEIIDELRVYIRDSDTTAYFTFSSRMRPTLHQFRMFGSKNGLILDQDNETLIRLPGSRMKSYAEKFVPPVQFAAQYLKNLQVNLGTFLRNDFHMKSGMKYLIESFYKSIEVGEPLPIRYSEILLTARIMDSIFKQLNEAAQSEEENISRSVSTTTS